MLIFSVYRYRVLRLDQSVDKLDLLLAGMTRNMGILEDNIRTLDTELVDKLGNCLLVAGYGIGRENYRITRLYLQDLMVAGRDPVKGGHCLAL